MKHRQMGQAEGKRDIKDKERVTVVDSPTSGGPGQRLIGSLISLFQCAAEHHSDYFIMLGGSLQTCE